MYRSTRYLSIGHVIEGIIFRFRSLTASQIVNASVSDNNQANRRTPKWNKLRKSNKGDFYQLYILKTKLSKQTNNNILSCRAPLLGRARNQKQSPTPWIPAFTIHIIGSFKNIKKTVHWKEKKNKDLRQLILSYLDEI